MKFYEKLLDWIVPLLMSGTLYMLHNISDDLNRIRVDVAVFSTEVRQIHDDYGKRLESLESVVFRHEHRG